jgi:RHS repeat-associated protein
VDGQSYSFDDNGNLLATGAMTNTFDAANRLTASTRDAVTVQPIYNGVGDKVRQTVGATTTNLALDVEGLPEVIYTSQGEVYLHLPGVIVTQKGSQTRYLLGDGLGSVRQAVNESGAVVAYYEFDPYGSPVNNTTGGEPYGFTGEWWESYISLLHLRARYYNPEIGAFISKDPIESEPPYLYVRGNSVNVTDPTGQCAQVGDDGCWSIYERIIFLCPECTEMERNLADGRRLKLHEENIHYLRNVLENIKNGWRPKYLSVPVVLDNANGYVEGHVKAFSAFVCVWTITGEEIVYDFASRQRQKFTYTEARGYQKGIPWIPPGLAFSLWGGSEAAYGGFLWGFSGRGIVGDYSGYFVGTSLGFNPGLLKGPRIEGGPALGWGQFTGAGNESNHWAAINGRGVVRGQVAYFGIGASSSIAEGSRVSKWPIDASMAGTSYEVVKDRPVDDYSRGQELQMLEDVRKGASSPVNIPNTMRNFGASVGANTFVKNGWITPVDYERLR